MKSTVQVKIFYLGVRVVEILPRPITIIIAKILAIIGYPLSKNTRNVTRKNLMYCNQTEFSYNTIKTISNYTICLADKLRIPTLDFNTLQGIVETVHIENLDKTLAYNRGAVLITGHIGNWDLGGVFLASLGYPLTAVVEEIPGLSDFYNFLRTSTGMETVFMRERGKMSGALNNNRMLVLLGDRDLTGRGVKVKFLSGEKLLPRGPAAFAIKHNAPIVFAFFVLNDNKRKPYRIEISEPVFPENRTFEELTQVVADKLSEYINKYPTQWFVFKDEWLN